MQFAGRGFVELSHWYANARGAVQPLVGALCLEPSVKQQLCLQRCALSSDATSCSTTMKEKAPKQKCEEPLTRCAMKIPDGLMMVWRDAAFVRKKTAAKPEGTPGVGRGEWDVSLLFEFCRPFERTEVISMRRPLKDRFQQTIKRIQMKLRCKKHLGDSGAVSDAASVDVRVDGVNVDSVLPFTNRDVLYEDSVNTLIIGGKPYRLVRDSVDCSSLRIDCDTLVGCPVVAAYDLRTGFGESSSSQVAQPTFSWFVGPESQSAVPPTGPNFHEAGYPLYTLDGWTYRHTGCAFVPSEEDIGKRVCAVVYLGPDTIVRCVLSNSLVVAKPSEEYIFEKRQLMYCERRAVRPNIRVMSYNVLADLYLDLDRNQEDLFFPYCPKEYQLHSYRIPLLLKEIPGYNADLIFLQEVDERLRRRYLTPVMNELGYEVCFKKKGLVVNEGLAICFRRDQFRLVNSYDVWLPSLLDVESFPENEDVLRLLDGDEALKELFMSRPAVLQLLSLEATSGSLAGEVLLTANTHLHFDPRHEHVKLLQALLCARLIRRVAGQLTAELGRPTRHALFAGDFNSDPGSGAYQLLSTGEITGQHECWKCGSGDAPSRLAITTEGDCLPKESRIEHFRSLAGDPPVTNYTRFQRPDGTEGGFAGCLDYIWAHGTLEVKSVVPMPSEELMSKHIALPSKICPSDHLPIICDILLE